MSSSFPPSFSSFPDFDALSKSKSERTASTEDFKQEKKKKHGPSSKKEKRRKREKESRRGSRERTPPPEDPSPKHEDSRQFEQNRFFYSDRKGDPLNIQYGGLHAGDIPRYHVVNSKVIQFFLGDN